MKVKLNQTLAGPEGVRLAESVIDMDEATAKALIESHQAIEMPRDTKVTEIPNEPMELEGGPQDEIEEEAKWTDEKKTDIYISRRRKNAPVQQS